MKRKEARPKVKLMFEVWKSIPNEPDYEVSNMARVRSYKGVGRAPKRRKEPVLLKLWEGNGYLIAADKRNISKALRRCYV